MNFLNEAKIHTNAANLAIVKKTADPNDEIHVMDEKKGKDIDGDGDVDSDDYLAARDKAIKKAKSMKESVTKNLYINAMESSSLEEFLDKMIKAYPDFDTEEKIKALKTYYLNAGGPIDEGKLSKAAGYIAIMAALLGLNKATSEKIYNSDPKIKAAIENYEKAKESGNKENMAKFEKEIKKRKLAWDAGRPMDEAKTIELPADTTFTVDLKHLMKKHMDEGKSKEDTIKFTKALMAKLHNKGEVTVDGTKVVFKEIQRLPNSNSNPILTGDPEKAKKPEYKLVTQQDIANNKDLFNDILNQLDGADLSNEGKKKSGYMGYTDMAEEADLDVKDTQLALPEPDAQDFLGDDGMDYEGGMAKSQMLKMKKYAMALCNMIDDESQLESWVQAKLTKASDYMSSVYHYLDYQESKMNESTLNEIEKQEFKFPNSPRVTMKTGMYAKDLTAGSKSEPAIDFVMPSSSKYRDSDNIVIHLSDTKFTNIDTLFNTLKQALGQSSNVHKLSGDRLRQIINTSKFIKMADKATIRDIEDEIKNSFRVQGDIDTFMDDLTDEDKKEFLDLMNSDLKGKKNKKP